MKIIFIILIVEKKIIYKIKINKKFKIIKKKIFIKLNSKDGSPDGMTLDKNNNLWVAHFHGAKFLYLIKKAKKFIQYKFPAKNITNCTFGGKNNRNFCNIS